MEGNTQQFENITLGQVGKILWRKKWIIVIAVVLFLGFAYLYLRYKTPLYSSEAKLKIAVTSTFQEINSPSVGGASAFMELEGKTELLRSEVILSEVVEKLQLQTIYYSMGKFGYSEMARNIPVKVVIKEKDKFPYWSKSLLISFDNTGESFEVIEEKTEKLLKKDCKLNTECLPGFHLFAEVSPEKLADRTFKIVVYPQNFWVNYIKQRLIILPSQGSVYRIQMKDPNPIRCASVINGICKQYLQSELKFQEKSYNQRLAFIDTLLIKIQEELRKAEILLENYEKGQKIPLMEQKKSYAATQYAELNQEYKELLRQKFELESLQDYLKNFFIPGLKKREQPGKLVFFAGVEIPSVVKDAVEQINKLIEERAKLLELRTLENEKVKRLDARLLENVHSLLKAIEDARKNAVSQMAKIRRELFNLEREFLFFPQVERSYLPLKRQYEVNQNLYHELLNTKFQVSIEKASLTSRSRILDKARTPSAPIEPNRPKVWLFSFIGGLLVGIVLAIVLEISRKTIDYEADLAPFKNRLPIVGRIQKYERNIRKDSLEFQLPVIYKPHSSLAENFRQLRINLDFILPRHKSVKFIGVSSTVSGEGKSFTALNLAATFSLLDKKVLLIDMDLRKPYLHNIINVWGIDDTIEDNIGTAVPSPGLSQLLIEIQENENIEIRDFVNVTGIKNFYILPAGPKPPNPAELIASGGMEKLMQKLQEKFDYVIIDTSPIGIVIDALPILQKCDATLYILRFHYSLQSFLRNPLELREQEILTKLYCVLNGVPKSENTYGYGSYYYRSKYKYNYYYQSSDEKTLWQRIKSFLKLS